MRALARRTMVQQVASARSNQALLSRLRQVVEGFWQPANLRLQCTKIASLPLFWILQDENRPPATVRRCHLLHTTARVARYTLHVTQHLPRELALLALIRTSAQPDNRPRQQVDWPLVLQAHPLYPETRPGSSSIVKSIHHGNGRMS